MSSSIIIDNSTLTAVQRLCGQIDVPRNYSVEGDYSAFENFLNALLFNDSFYAIDDYKDEFKQQRQSQFGYIRHVPISSFPYEELHQRSIELTSGLMLEIKSGDLTRNALTEFLEAMGLTLTAAWHMQSSDYFLTLKVLSDHPETDGEKYKYTPLTSAIFSQLTGDGRLSDTVNVYLESSQGREIPIKGFDENGASYGISQELLDFSNSLNWLSRRATFYTLAAAHFDASFCLHPIRHNFTNSLARERKFFTQTKFWRDNFRKFFGDQATSTINAINEKSEYIEIGENLPLLAAWSVGKTGNASKAIEMVMDFRAQNQAVNLRQRLAELEAAREHGDKKEINRLHKAIDLEKTDILKRHGIETSPGVSVRASIAPDVSLTVTQALNISDLKLKFGPAKNVRGVFRNIVEDIVRFPELGSVRSNLLALVSRSKNESDHVLRIEESRFRYARPHWKKPM